MQEFDSDLLEAGKAHIERKEFGLAIAVFKEGFAKFSASQEFCFELGKAYYLQGEFRLAIETFKELLRLDPGYIYAYIMLAKSYLACGDQTLAQETAKEACKLNTAGPRETLELCGFFRENKMQHFAIACYEKLPRDEMDDAAVLDLARLYNFQGEFAKAREAADYLLNRNLKSEFLRNKALNESEISRGRLCLESKPSILLVTLTNRCNLNCYMCGRGSSAWDVPKVITDQVVSLLPYLELITWQGGEVFLAENFSRLFDNTFGFAYLNQIIITNALLIDGPWAQRIASRGNVGLTISIDSVDKKTYEYIRRGANFEKLIKNLHIINKARKDNPKNKTVTTLRCTIMRANYKQLENFIEFARDFEFDVIQMAPLSVDTYDPEDIFVHKDPEVVRYLSGVMPDIRGLAGKYNIKLLDWLPTDFNDKKPAEEAAASFSENVPRGGKIPVCFRPFRQLAMNVKGYFFPECLCTEPVGDVFHNTLEEVWNNEKMQAYRSKLLHNGFTDWCRLDCVSGAVPPEHLKSTFA
jgi:MoaA/NifB/PqqE/SkfB family radical SAM enzyme